MGLGQDARPRATTAPHRPARPAAAPRAARQRSPPLLLRAHRPHALPRRTARCRFPTRLRRTCLCANDPSRACAADTRGDRLRQRHEASLGRRHVRELNDRYRRTGTLWEARFKAYPVQSVDHLLRCYRYIELNPVRARRVSQPGDYARSSYAANAQGAIDPLVCTPAFPGAACGRNSAPTPLRRLGPVGHHAGGSRRDRESLAASARLRNGALPTKDRRATAVSSGARKDRQTSEVNA